jgi:hypothetical protein
MFTQGVMPIKSSATNTYAHPRCHANKSSSNTYAHPRYHANKEQ